MRFIILFQSEPKPSLSHENLLINELIRDYLEFNSYNYTSSVLLAGSCNTHSLIKAPQCCWQVAATHTA